MIIPKNGFYFIDPSIYLPSRDTHWRGGTGFISEMGLAVAMFPASTATWTQVANQEQRREAKKNVKSQKREATI